MSTAKPARPPEARPDREAEEPHGETLAEFKASFAYGSRTDLLFKFLKRLPDEEVGRFFHELLARLGETVDDGDAARLLSLVYEWNVRGYAADGDAPPFRYDEGPFAALDKPVSGTRLGLVTATGSFVAGDDPAPFGEAGMTQAEAIPRIQEFLKAPPTLSAVPLDTPRERLRVRHPGYDIRAVARDPNVGFPLDRLRELEGEGAVGGLLPEAFSFVGAAAQTPIMRRLGPEWAALLRERGAGAVLLVPV